MTDLAEWLGVEDTDPLLPVMLATATGMMIRWVGLDFEPRDWTVTYWDWPTVGTRSPVSLSGRDGYPSREINMPYAGLIDVTSVEVYGEATTDYIPRQSSIILLSMPALTGPHEGPAIMVGYRAGFDDDVPQELKSAVLALAAYLYEHRGHCDVGQAIHDSGAAVMAQGWRDARVMV